MKISDERELKLAYMKTAKERRFELVNWLREDYKYFTIEYTAKKSHLYRYDGQCYRQHSLKKLKQEIETYLSSDYSDALGNQIYKQIELTRILSKDEIALINSYAHLIPYKNCCYDYVNQIDYEYNPEMFYTQTLNVNYSESADCPRFQQFMKEVIPNEEDRLRVVCFLAYSLTPRIDIRIAQIWTGGGSNGKTELAKLPKFILGDLCKNIPMGKFMKDNQFILANLMGVWLNIGSEFNRTGVKDIGIDEMKRIISDPILFSEKKGVDGFNFPNYCKHIFTINDLPSPTGYMDTAFFDRFQIVQFTERFTKENKVPNLMDKIYTEEGPQIVRYLVNHFPVLERVLESDAVKCERDWRQNTLPLFRFLDDYCINQMKGRDLPIEFETETRTVYKNYCLFCETLKREPKTIEAVGKLLKANNINKYQQRGRWVYDVGCTYPMKVEDLVLDIEITEEFL